MTHWLLNNLNFSVNTLDLLAQSFWLPAAGSKAASNYHFIFNLILYVTSFFFLLVVGLMLLFVIKYRRRTVGGDKQQKVATHNTPLEITWTGIPLIIVIVFFFLGFKGFMDLDQPPSDAIVIDVTGSKWAFLFTYPNGAQSKDLYIPLNKSVVLNMTATDVLHSLYIPAFGVQKNLIPQQTTQMWFQATTLTTDDRPITLFCTQYCGQGHSQMGSGNPDITKASFCYVKTESDWKAKLDELGNIFVDSSTKKPLPLRVVGEKLYRNIGCASCHSTDGSEGQGPTYKGLYKCDVEYFTSEGQPGILRKTDSDKLWDDYLRESVVYAGKKIVKGRQNVMPPYESQFTGSAIKERKLEAIIEYIKSLGPDYKPLPDPTVAPGTPVATPAPSK
ncbi:MAG: cytochrome c oxidase subunit II transmembrane domain-containing protein [Phycisphaerae bacterium]